MVVVEGKGGGGRGGKEGTAVRDKRGARRKDIGEHGNKCRKKATYKRTKDWLGERTRQE